MQETPTLKDRLKEKSIELERAAYRDAVKRGMSGDLATDLKNNAYENMGSYRFMKRHGLKVVGAVLVLIALYLVVM